LFRYIDFTQPRSAIAESETEKYFPKYFSDTRDRAKNRWERKGGSKMEGGRHLGFFVKIKKRDEGVKNTPLDK